MPGMMDTVLNLGLGDVTVEAIAKSSGDERFAWDSYRRFIQMYSNVVLEVEHHNFEEILEVYKDQKGYQQDTDLSGGRLAQDRRQLQGSRGARDRQALPAGCARAALGRDRARCFPPG